MKILHINSYYGAGKFYKNLYDKQVESGLDIDVYVPVSSEFKSNNFDYGQYTKVRKNHYKIERLFFHLKHFKIYKDIKGQYNLHDFSVTHAHSLFSNGYIALKLNKKYHTPYIVAVRNTDVNVFFKKMIHLRSLGVEILKRAHQIVFLSKPYRDHTIEKYIPKDLQQEIYNKSTIIPNGIDEFWFDNLGKKKHEPRSHLRLLQIGDINDNKNIETTVEAVQVLNKQGYKVKLDVVGNVKDQKVFNNIKDFHYVNYLGYKSKEELLNIYRNNDIFVMPSKNETFGLVYAEAMSQGLPVIYTKGQGFDGHFEDGKVGYSVNCYDNSDIAKKVSKIVNNYNDISERCLIQSQKFNWQAITEQYQKLYTT